jgi:EmrB/QacA subfamily drug resistance transporter
VSGLQWTIDAYTLVLASLLMLSGSTADRIGRRLVFQLGLSVFSLGSLLCALAPSLGFLVGARMVQAIGGSMLNPVALSIIRNVFEDPRERAQAIGVWGAVFGLSMSLGPTLGGVLVDSVGWRAVFLVNLPVGVLALVLTAIVVPESRAARARRADPIGQMLVIVGLAALTYAIIQSPSDGWLSAQTLGLFAVSLVAFVALVLYELRRREPLIEVRFFASAPFSGASAIAIVAFASVGGFLFLNTLYLQTVRGLSPLDAGLCVVPLGLATLVAAPLSGRLTGSRGPRLSLVVGSLGLIVGAAILTQLTTTTPFALLLFSYAVFGMGNGMVNPPITNTAVSGMPPAQAGVAAAIASTSRQVGTTLGVALLGSLAAGATAGTIGPAFPAATHASFWVMVGLGTIALGLGVLTTTPWAMRTARRTAERYGGDRSQAADTRGESAELAVS